MPQTLVPSTSLPRRFQFLVPVCRSKYSSRGTYCPRAALPAVGGFAQHQLRMPDADTLSIEDIRNRALSFRARLTCAAISQLEPETPFLCECNFGGEVNAQRSQSRTLCLLRFYQISNFYSPLLFTLISHYFYGPATSTANDCSFPQEILSDIAE